MSIKENVKEFARKETFNLFDLSQKTEFSSEIERGGLDANVEFYHDLMLLLTVKNPSDDYLIKNLEKMLYGYEHKLTLDIFINPFGETPDEVYTYTYARELEKICEDLSLFLNEIKECCYQKN